MNNLEQLKQKDGFLCKLKNIPYECAGTCLKYHTGETEAVGTLYVYCLQKKNASSYKSPSYGSELDISLLIQLP